MNYVTHCVNENVASADRTAETTINLLYEYLSTNDIVTKFYDVTEVAQDSSSSEFYISLIPLTENLNDTCIKIYANTKYVLVKYIDINNSITIINSTDFSYNFYINICSDESQIKISLNSASSSSIVSFTKFFMLTPIKLNTGESSTVLIFSDSSSSKYCAILNKSSIKSGIVAESGSNINDNSGYVLLRKFTLITTAGNTITFDKIFSVFGTTSFPARFTVNNKEYFGFDGVNICALFE